MTKEITIKKKYVKYGLWLLLALMIVVGLEFLPDPEAQSSDAATAAKEGMIALFSIDFRRDVAGQLPPCTVFGQEFWPSYLDTVRQEIKEQGWLIRSATGEQKGNPEPYNGLAGKGQIVPVKLSITYRNQSGRSETRESELQVLMIQNENDEWLLDAPVLELPEGGSQ